MTRPGEWSGSLPHGETRRATHTTRPPMAAASAVKPSSAAIHFAEPSGHNCERSQYSSWHWSRRQCGCHGRRVGHDLREQAQGSRVPHTKAGVSIDEAITQHDLGHLPLVQALGPSLPRHKRQLLLGELPSHIDLTGGDMISMISHLGEGDAHVSDPHSCSRTSSCCW